MKAIFVEDLANWAGMVFVGFSALVANLIGGVLGGVGKGEVCTCSCFWSTQPSARILPIDFRSFSFGKARRDSVLDETLIDEFVSTIGRWRDSFFGE